MNYLVIVPNNSHSGMTNLAIDTVSLLLDYGCIAHGKVVFLRKTSEKDIIRNGIKLEKIKLQDLSKPETIIHTHGLIPDLIAGLLKFFFKSKYRAVTTIHQYLPYQLSLEKSIFFSFIFWPIWRNAILKTDAIVFISSSMERFYKYRLQSEKMKTIYNFSLQKISEKNQSSYGNYKNINKFIEESRKGNNDIVIYVGSINHRKNIVQFVDFIKDKRFSIIIAGDGPKSHEIKTLAREYPERILFLGQCSNLEFLYKKCDYLVLPSFSEGMPLVVLEAISHGLPVLLSNIAVHRELCSYGIGRCFNHKNFSNFEIISRNIRKDYSREDVINVYKKNFSGVQSARKYCNLLKGICNEG